MKAADASFKRRVAAALRRGSALVGCPGDRWVVVGATGLRLKDEQGHDLTLSSRTLDRWGWWPPWKLGAEPPVPNDV